jgi:hypothetical protein
VDELKSCRVGCSRSPGTKFDNQNSGASGEIRTLKRLFLRQAAIPIRTPWPSLVHRGGFESPRPTRGNRVTARPFYAASRTLPNLAEGRRIGSSSLLTKPVRRLPINGTLSGRGTPDEFSPPKSGSRISDCGVKFREALQLGRDAIPCHLVPVAQNRPCECGVQSLASAVRKPLFVASLELKTIAPGNAAVADQQDGQSHDPGVGESTGKVLEQELFEALGLGTPTLLSKCGEVSRQSAAPPAMPASAP